MTEMEIYSGANDRPDFLIRFPGSVTAEQIAEFEERYIAARAAARRDRPAPEPVDLSWVTFEPTKPVWPVWLGFLVVGGTPFAALAAGVGVAWLVTR